MCGGQNSRVSGGGALAVMGPPSIRTSTSPIPMAGRLLFHNRTDESSHATHAVFTVDESPGFGSRTSESFVIMIHETGDLTKPATTSPSWATFSLNPAIGTVVGAKVPSLEVELGRPMKIEVGIDGIIGRRVSVWTQNGAGPIAEGIVGYN
ncbi:hypothetical protein F5Y01DRAFT_297445 [Xylaria sp. FL0043]|nr:hypothetical protein F5Y01DRAFT_297445 [Xylaria sp. FL0043]